jgi:hypothetical protein
MAGRGRSPFLHGGRCRRAISIGVAATHELHRQVYGEPGAQRKVHAGFGKGGLVDRRAQARYGDEVPTFTASGRLRGTTAVAMVWLLHLARLVKRACEPPCQRRPHFRLLGAAPATGLRTAYARFAGCAGSIQQRFRFFGTDTWTSCRLRSDCRLSMADRATIWSSRDGQVVRLLRYPLRVSWQSLPDQASDRATSKTQEIPTQWQPVERPAAPPRPRSHAHRPREPWPPLEQPDMVIS